MGKIIYYDMLDPTNQLRSEFKNRLWSIDDYTKINIERIYPVHHPYTGTKIFKDLSKIRRWMENDCEGEIIIKQQASAGELHVLAYFELEEDAVQCKLMWGGEDG